MRGQGHKSGSDLSNLGSVVQANCTQSQPAPLQETVWPQDIPGILRGPCGRGLRSASGGEVGLSAVRKCLTADPFVWLPALPAFLCGHCLAHLSSWGEGGDRAGVPGLVPCGCPLPPCRHTALMGPAAQHWLKPGLRQSSTDQVEGSKLLPLLPEVASKWDAVWPVEKTQTQGSPTWV